MSNKTLFGIPVEVDDNAPSDKVVLHPTLWEKMERCGFVRVVKIRTCGKVVGTSNPLVSSYCGLTTGHEGDCKVKE